MILMLNDDTTNMWWSDDAHAQYGFWFYSFFFSNFVDVAWCTDQMLNTINCSSHTTCRLCSEMLRLGVNQFSMLALLSAIFLKIYLRICLNRFHSIRFDSNYHRVYRQMSRAHLVNDSSPDNDQMYYIMWTVYEAKRTQILVTLSSLSTRHLICQESGYRYNFTECPNEILNCQDTCSEIPDSFILWWFHSFGIVAFLSTADWFRTKHIFYANAITNYVWFYQALCLRTYYCALYTLKLSFVALLMFSHFILLANYCS